MFVSSCIVAGLKFIFVTAVAIDNDDDAVIEINLTESMDVSV
jgi:hypothetical protein